MRRSIKAILQIALLAMLVLVVTVDIVEAQRPGRSRGSGWKFVSEKYDADKDGSVSLSEYTRGEEAFKTLDANSDGVLSEKDWKGKSRRKTIGNAPREGDVAPDFSLTQIEDAESTVTLSEFAGEKPVALLFGSCT